MNSDKDYYAVLGVAPYAEDVVVRAAYRALAQRYHPDRFGGSPEESHARMTELNEAYGVLSEKEKRVCYDRSRGARVRSGGSRLSDSEERSPPGADPLEKDWGIALKYYPELAAIEKRLAKYSWKLANAYRACLMDTRQFEMRDAVAGLMENHFLTAYFGTNEQIRQFARTLIEASERDAARSLNDAIRVLGGDADPGRVVSRITQEFKLQETAAPQPRNARSTMAAALPR